MEFDMSCVGNPEKKGGSMKEKAIIYGKAGWPHTEKARSAYGKNATYYDVQADSLKLEEMLKHSKGVRNVPVIVEGSKVIVGYGGSWGV
jgi:glutaredoxin